MSEKVKIAILGGGVSAMTAAWYLSHVEDWQDHFEITVYQMGWRLGGKGASGRNGRIANRIEEHGFHFWWGFYDNSFRLIQRCYEEANRPKGSPMATWQEAFKPVGYTVNMSCFGGRWTPQTTPLVINDWTPGEDPDKATTAAEFISQLLANLIEGLQGTEHADIEVPLPKGVQKASRFSWWKTLLSEIGESVGEFTAVSTLKLAHRLADMSDDNPHSLTSRVRYEMIELLVTAFIGGLWLAVKDEVLAEKDFNLYNEWIAADIACATIRGMIKDDVVAEGYDVVNDWDYREWLGRQGGAKEITLQSAAIRGIYDLVFAYEGGVNPRLEAGTALRTVLRMALDTRGPFIWHMESGMGDTIFVPLYQVLQRRGVQFKFFHRVEQLHLAEDGKSIDGITIARQVTVKEDQAYQPLVYPKGLPSWPNEPLYDQIVEGEKLSERIVVAGQEQPKYNLESFWTPWENAETLRLKKGEDFDLVVLGTSLGPLRWLCKELLDNEDKKWGRWRDMLHHVKSVQTQAFQLWLRPDLSGLGWSRWRDGATIVSCYDVSEPCSDDNTDSVDAWADMTHVIKRETWPDDHYPYYLAYFAAAMRTPDLFELPPPTDTNFPHEQFRQVKENALHFLRHHVQPVWPKATAPDGEYPHALNWELLVDLQEREGEDRFNSQYWRVNVDPSQRYVLTVPGSTQYRLETDESGCDNLYLTGDWIKNGANAGFVESAVISGMLTSQVITKKLLGQRFPAQVICWPDAPQP